MLSQLFETVAVFLLGGGMLIGGTGIYHFLTDQSLLTPQKQPCMSGKTFRARENLREHFIADCRLLGLGFVLTSIGGLVALLGSLFT